MWIHCTAGGHRPTTRTPGCELAVLVLRVRPWCRHRGRPAQSAVRSAWSWSSSWPAWICGRLARVAQRGGRKAGPPGGARPAWASWPELVDLVVQQLQQLAAIGAGVELQGLVVGQPVMGQDLASGCKPITRPWASHHDVRTPPRRNVLVQG